MDHIGTRSKDQGRLRIHKVHIAVDVASADTLK